MVLKLSKRFIFICLLLSMILPFTVSGEKIELTNLTQMQVERLALKVKKNTPENVHFEPSAKFNWVLLHLDESNPENINKAVVALFKKHYIVYFDEKDIPKDYINYREGLDGQMQKTSYINGFSFSFFIKFVDSDTIEAEYSDWEGILASSVHLEKYQWNGTDWITVYKGRPIVS